MHSLNESILNSFKEAFLIEDYKSAKVKLVEKGVSENEADSLISRHKELKRLNRLNKDLIDIDTLVKNFSPEEIKTKLFNISTQTKSEIKKHIEGKIVAENDEYLVYKIDTPEEAYRFHGLTKWCICSGDKEQAKNHFEHYSNEYKNVFYFFVRKQITDPDDAWNYIALQRSVDKDDVYWDMEDDSHKLTDIPVELPEFDKPPLEKLSFEERLEKAGFKKNSNGEYDVDGDVYFENFPELITDGKFNIKFGKVSGNFDCYGYKNLTSLEGCPREVGGGFYCSHCRGLKNLEGAPEKVGGVFLCCNCYGLTSLKGAAKKVGGDFICSSCKKLISLEWSPREVGGSFECVNCENLTSLEGVPKKVGGDFSCCGCTNLTSLKGVPRKISGIFDCSECDNLTSLEGAPREVDKDFWCNRCNKLRSLEGAPEKVGGDFNCDICGIDFTEDDVKERCEVSGIIRV